jgi:protein-S-isoprenylcysteine O-methyltransferase Ste14
MKLRLFQTAFVVLWSAELFSSAGSLSWVRGWIYMGAGVVGMGGMALAVRRYNPGLFEARAKVHRKQMRTFDKVFMAIYVPLALLQAAIAGLDAVRFRWSSMPFAAAYAGVPLVLLGCAAMAWPMSVNPFAENTVRIQTERGHTVVASGPYRFVRHPMYVGLILLFLGTPLILGSWWALADGAVIAVLFVWRTGMEDRTLRRELAGYEEFTMHTRYRLVPGLW